MRSPKKDISAIVKVALKEDLGRGDVTTKLTIPPRKRIKAVILAKQKGVVCGLDVAKLCFKAVDKKISFRPKLSDGQEVKIGKVIACLVGEARNILKAERVALNFLCRLSGIATRTSQFVQRVRPYCAKIMDTRKTTPGLRTLEKYAVCCGGGFNHRMGLWDQVLVKDNHISICGLKQLIEKIRATKPKGMKVEIEVKNLREFKQALLAKPDIIMLDNFNIKNITKAIKMKSEKLELEVSGGVNLSNVRKIAATGVERISIGELTHSAPALDIALNCE